MLGILPFAVLLLGIAVLPLAIPHAWEKNKNKAIFTALIALPTATYILANDYHMLEHAALEYFSFIVLLASLYVTAGGVVLKGDLRRGTMTNAGLLSFGSVLASIIGTTGASMLLLRPMLRANRGRAYTRHVPIFFIFIVSNAGGLLTPLGDPPLFLGFLRGVPFTWTFKLFPEWIFVNAIMGANTYIGNGPNFMVKAIAEEAGFKMPSFFGYLLWSGPILGSIWLAVGFLFIR